MNHIYRLVWNDRQQAYVAATENARSKGKSSSVVGTVLAGVVLALAGHAGMAGATQAANTLPTGGQVSAGVATISSSANTLTVDQSSQRAAINWNSFNVGSNATVNFNQPNASAITLNRVVGGESSVIDGAINANGNVWILNSSGILFNRSAQVNVGGLVASTLGMNDSDFMASHNSFSANGSQASVINLGSINAADSGYVALLGNQVSNQGVISARLGTAALAAGDRVSLNFNGNSLVGVAIDQGTLNALVENKQAIHADGGQVILTAQGLDAVLASVVNNSGEIRAQSVANHAGHILLLGDKQSGLVSVDGTLDASAPNGGNGGFIETSAAHVKVADTARVSTAAPLGLSGTWLMDPLDFTIGTGGDITGTALGSALNAGNVTIQTAANGPTCSGVTCGSGTAGNGDIFIKGAVSWSAHTLTLNAWRNINISSSLTGSGTASLALLYGQGAVSSGNAADYYVNTNYSVSLPAGQNFSTKLGSDGTLISYTVINSLGGAGSTTGTDLQGINGILSGNYALGADIWAPPASAAWNSGAGFTPLGNSTTGFSGIFAGLGHVVGQIAINSPSTDYVGMFGMTTSTAVVRDVNMLYPTISGQHYTGGLVGYNSGTISNSSVMTDDPWNSCGTACYVHGAGSDVGGIAGYNNGSISHVTVNGPGGGIGFYGTSGVVDDIGGVVGYNDTAGTVSWATFQSGTTEGGVSHSGGFSSNVGGVVGYNAGAIADSVSNGGLQSNGNVIGGLVGLNDTAGTITNSYSTSTVNTVSTKAGGLVGTNAGTINNSFVNSSNSTASIYAPGGTVGGLVALNSGTITNSYASASVGATGYANTVGLLVGTNTGTVTNSYWNASALLNNSSTSGIGFGSGGSGVGVSGAQSLTAAQLKSPWNFATGTGASQWNYFGPTSTPSGWTPAQGNTPPSVWGYTSNRTTNGGMPVLCALFTCATMVFVEPNTGSSTYGSTPSPAKSLVDNTGANLTLLNAALSGTAAMGAPTATSNVGTYNLTYTSGLTLSGSGASSYVLMPWSAPIAWTVNPATLYYTANLATMTYGDSVPALTGSVTGLVNGQTLGNVTTGTVVFSASAASTSDVGQYAVSGGGLNLPGNSNYQFAQASANATALTITPATLYYTANPASVAAGASVSPSSLSGTVVGFVNGDTLVGATTGSAIWTAASTPSSAPGNYAIDGSGLAANHGNYVFMQAASNANALTVSASSGVGNEIASALLSPTGAEGISDRLPTAGWTVPAGNSVGSKPDASVALIIAGAAANLAGMFGQGTSLELIAAPDGDESSQVMSLSDARDLLSRTNSAQVTGASGAALSGDREVRVPASRNSLAEIVNGGVKLPNGVEQQLFVVKAY